MLGVLIWAGLDQGGVLFADQYRRYSLDHLEFAQQSLDYLRLRYVF